MTEFTLYRWSDLLEEELGPGLRRRMVIGADLMVAHVYFDQGRTIARHSHENEQLTYILEGALEFRLGDANDEVVVRAGEVLHIPSNLPHEAVALENTLDVDIFHPPRADWIDGTDAYLRQPSAS
jgi:quercetin dioxygenase-like cupin family protein